MKSPLSRTSSWNRSSVAAVALALTAAGGRVASLVAPSVASAPYLLLLVVAAAGAFRCSEQSLRAFGRDIRLGFRVAHREHKLVKTAKRMATVQLFVGVAVLVHSLAN